MDINVLRGLITVLSFAVFVGIVFWAYSGRRRKRFEEAARLPFEEDELPARTSGDVARAGTRGPIEQRTGSRADAAGGARAAGVVGEAGGAGPGRRARDGVQGSAQTKQTR